MTGSVGHRRAGRGVVAAVTLVVLATTLAACSSTSSSTATTAASDSSGSSGSSASSGRSAIPASAFSDHTGITATSVSIANISTESAGLFTGAVVGTKAYADYIDSLGGINGRKLVVDASDDQFEGALNKQLTEEAVQNDVGLVGGFSLEDSFGGTVLAANPAVPDISQILDTTTEALPNAFSWNPSAGGWQLGPLAYFKQRFPADVTHTGAMIAGEASAETTWAGEKATMIHSGYRVVYDPTYPVSQTDFTANAVAMKNVGVKILFLEQMPENYAAAMVKALDQQNFHPVVVFGGAAYSEALVPDAGGAAAIDGAYLDQGTSLYLGEDANVIPAVKTFLTWVQKTDPGYKADYYAMSGWVSAELFADALQAAGKDPSRGSILEALRKTTAFNAQYLVGTANPADRQPNKCYVIAQIVNGKFQRLDDPPTNGPTHGYRCDLPYYYPPS